MSKVTKISSPSRPLADVNVLEQADGSKKIVVCFMPDPDIIVGEGNSKALLAIDASSSMKKEYGLNGVFGGDPNHVQTVARKLGGMLTEVTRSGKVSGIYWAMGNQGNVIEEIGEHDNNGWTEAVIRGPKKNWGRGTKLLPALQYAVDIVAVESDWTMAVILTDGIIEDEKQCMDYCFRIGQELADGKRKILKFVLIGVGEDVDEEQLNRFDNMFEGTNLEDKVDLFAAGSTSSMQNDEDILATLYGELINEESTVASSGVIYDLSGNQIAKFTDGLPGKFIFNLPKGQIGFKIKIGTHEIVQDISEVL